MQVYSLENANYLIQYYADKMIGKIIEGSKGSKVIHLDKESYGNNQYLVNVVGTLVKGVIGVFHPRRSVNLVSKDLHLPSPEFVLSHRDQM